jgi:hypothetical protein
MVKLASPGTRVWRARQCRDGSSGATLKATANHGAAVGWRASPPCRSSDRRLSSRRTYVRDQYFARSPRPYDLCASKVTAAGSDTGASADSARGQQFLDVKRPRQGRHPIGRPCGLPDGSASLGRWPGSPRCGPPIRSRSPSATSQASRSKCRRPTTRPSRTASDSAS